MEKQMEILRLEKELERARNQLMSMRKAEYTESLNPDFKAPESRLVHTNSTTDIGATNWRQNNLKKSVQQQLTDSGTFKVSRPDQKFSRLLYWDKICGRLVKICGRLVGWKFCLSDKINYLCWKIFFSVFMY
jgi:hypothetical protein